jgi:hypothetical protein
MDMMVAALKWQSLDESGGEHETLELEIGLDSELQ